MKIKMSKQEVIALVKDHFPIPSGFRMDEAEWGTYNDYLEISLEVIPPRTILKDRNDMVLGSHLPSPLPPRVGDVEPTGQLIDGQEF